MHTLKRPKVSELKTPSDRQGYARWALELWQNGQYKPLVQDLFSVFSVEVAVVAVMEAELDIASPNKQTLIAFLKELSDWSTRGSKDPTAAFVLETVRLCVDAPKVTRSKAIQPDATSVGFPPDPKTKAAERVVPKQSPQSGPTAPFDQQRVSEALQVFLKNPNDNNHMRLSRLLSAYAASHAGMIKQDYVPASERSESIRAFSGGRCSPR